MRLKRKNEKGEIFRKSLCCEPCSDSDDIDVIRSDTDNQKTTKQKKTEDNFVHESTQKRKKESSKKQMTSSHHRKRPTSRDCISTSNNKQRRSKQKSSIQEDNNSRKQQQSSSRDFIISKNRITRSLGIYNKAKRSDTVMRENLKQKFSNKKFEDIKSKTARDMARVLDCSSFKIELSSCSAGLVDGQDSPVYPNFRGTGQLTQSPSGSNRTHSTTRNLKLTKTASKCLQKQTDSKGHNVNTSSCSSTGKYSNPDRSRITPLWRINPHRITPQNETTLAFKTPLQEISLTLTGTLKPSETFHGRNYLAEVQGQLKKMYKQSSVSSHAQRMSNRICIASEVQKRCLKRKSQEKNVRSMESKSLEKTAQTVEHQPLACLFGSEGQTNTPVLQQGTSNDIKQHNRLLQTATSRDTSRETKTSRGTSQSNIHFQFQDKCVSGVSNRERRIIDDQKENDILHAREVQRCLFGRQDARLSHTDTHTLASTHRSSSFDILDFLDGVDHGSDLSGETQAHRDYMTPDPKLVSPPKKPALDSPIPEKKFYPHKLY